VVAEQRYLRATERRRMMVTTTMVTTTMVMATQGPVHQSQRDATSAAEFSAI
jgi:hypothetical protein